MQPTYLAEICPQCGARACRAQKIAIDANWIRICPDALVEDVHCGEMGCCHGCDCYEVCPIEYGGPEEDCDCDCHLERLRLATDPVSSDSEESMEVVVVVATEKPPECQCVPCRNLQELDIWYHSGESESFVVNRPRDCLRFIALGTDAVSSYYDNSDGRNHRIDDYMSQ